MNRALAVFAVAAFAGGPALSFADLAEIRSRGTLRVIVSADEAPETFDQKGGPRPGFEGELVESFARLQGVKTEIVPARGLAARIPTLLGGRGDLIVAIFDTAERRQQVAFTAEIMPTYTVAVTLSPKPAVPSLEALQRERVGVVRGAAPADEAAAAGVKSLRPFESLKEMLDALADGQIGALVMPISEFVLARKAEQRLTAGVAVGPTGSVAWAVRKEDVALRAALDDHLANVRRSAAWNQLLVKYFGEQAPVVLGRRR